MPRVPESHLEDRRRQILHAAVRCYERKGFHRTSVRDICEEADLSVGAVYRYFDGKDEILEAVAEAGRDNTAALVEDVEKADRPRETARRFIETALAPLACEEGRRSARMDVRLRSEALDREKLRGLGREQYTALREELAGRLEASGAATAGDATDDDAGPADLARVLLALVAGAQTTVALGFETDVDAYVRGFEALLDPPAPEDDPSRENRTETGRDG